MTSAYDLFETTREAVDKFMAEDKRMTNPCNHSVELASGNRIPFNGVECPYCKINLLRGNLSLAEEGLASATQEIGQLQGQYAAANAMARARAEEIARLSACWAEALGNVTARNQEIERLYARWEHIRQAKLTWAMACPCECAACDTFFEVFRVPAAEPGAQLREDAEYYKHNRDVMNGEWASLRRLLQKFVAAWEGLPGAENMDRLCEMARTAGCAPEPASREPTPSEAASFAKTLARSPRRIEPAPREASSPGPMQVQHPAPCWCPYCGEPHSPAVRATREASSEPRKDSDYCKHGFAPGHCWFATCGNRETAVKSGACVHCGEHHAVGPCKESIVP